MMVGIHRERGEILPGRGDSFEMDASPAEQSFVSDVTSASSASSASLASAAAASAATSMPRRHASNVLKLDWQTSRRG